MDPSVQAILDGPSVMYVPVSAFKAGVGSHVEPSPAKIMLSVLCMPRGPSMEAGDPIGHR